MIRYTAAVTLLTVAFYFYLATRVAAARGRLGVPLPATTGNTEFERLFRVHANTLEWLPTFLLPLCAAYLSDALAASGSCGSSAGSSTHPAIRRRWQSGCRASSSSRPLAPALFIAAAVGSPGAGAAEPPSSAT